jgi:flagellin-like protein
VSEVITAVILIAVIFVLGIAFGYLMAMFAGRRK